MILAVDVDYRAEGGAVAAGVAFGDWADARPERVLVRRIASVQPYRPGAFYERELPCILALLEEVAPTTIVVDGYVWLGAEGAPGLGAHVFAALDACVPVVGVAKTWFARTPPETELLRGQSQKPLYVTAAGMALAEAKERIRAMHGAFRIPTLLALADRTCRTG